MIILPKDVADRFRNIKIEKPINTNITVVGNNHDEISKEITKIISEIEGGMYGR